MSNQIIAALPFIITCKTLFHGVEGVYSPLPPIFLIDHLINLLLPQSRVRHASVDILPRVGFT